LYFQIIEYKIEKSSNLTPVSNVADVKLTPVSNVADVKLTPVLDVADVKVAPPDQDSSKVVSEVHKKNSIQGNGPCSNMCMLTMEGGGNYYNAHQAAPQYNEVDMLPTSNDILEESLYNKEQLTSEYIGHQTVPEDKGDSIASLCSREPARSGIHIVWEEKGEGMTSQCNKEPVCNGGKESVYTGGKEPVYTEGKEPVYNYTGVQTAHGYWEDSVPSQCSNEPSYTGGKESAHTGGKESAYTGGKESAYTGGNEPVYCLSELIIEYTKL